MSKRKIKATVICQKMIAADIFDLKLSAKEIACQAAPGQFVDLYCADGSKLLPRPISLCEIDKEEGILRLVYRIAGAGTAMFSKLKAGDTIDILGPLGNGFTLRNKKAILIGGGIGIPPMLELAKELDADKQILVGYRNKDLFLEEDLAKYGNVYIATEDGSVGTGGNVMDAIRVNHLSADVIMACGPMPMLRAIKQYAEEQGIEAYISLEERMACGVGACLGCVCRTREVDHHSHVNNARICTDGPVFEAKEVEI